MYEDTGFYKGYGRYLKNDVKKLIGGYFLAQFRIMFVVAVILVVGFLVLGIKYAFLIGVLVAILDFLPLFGTGTVLIPWALFKLLSADYLLAAGLALLYVLTQVIRQVIQPKIVGDSMGLPPLWTLVFLYLGFKIHGISGMIIAVPLGIFVMNLYQYGAVDGMIESAKELGDEIPISAQIVSLADVYDALISERAYKKGFTHERTIEMILGGECGIFNPILIECFMEIEQKIKQKMLEIQ